MSPEQESLFEAYKIFQNKAEEFTDFQKLWREADPVFCAAAMIYFYLAALQCQLKLQKSGATQLLNHAIHVTNFESQELGRHVQGSNLCN